MILLYIERGWFYPSRKPLQGLFFKFLTSQNRSRNRSVRDLRVRFGINTYRKFRSGFTGSSGLGPEVPIVYFHLKLRLPPPTIGSSGAHRKFRSRTESTDRKFRSPNRYFLGGITPSFEPQIERSIYVFRTSRREKHNDKVRYTF
jgi:hypothetical protein